MLLSINKGLNSQESRPLSTDKLAYIDHLLVIVVP